MCGNIEVALDEVKRLGSFIEAEAKGDFKDVVEAKKVCLDFLKNIGIENIENNQIKTGYPQLLLEN